MTVHLPMASIVVCSRNGARRLSDCLSAIKHQDYEGKLEIIVVDDGSTDDTYIVAKSFTNVEVIKNAKNLGLGAARNVGIRAAQGEIVAFTDDDCRPQSDWITNLCSGYTGSEVLGVGGFITPQDTDNFVLRYTELSEPIAPLDISLLASQALTYRFGLYLKKMVSLRGHVTRSMPQQVYSLVGANMSFRRSVLNEFGMFDERFRFGCEEVELCKRINDFYPGSLVVVSRCRVKHQYERTLIDLLRRSRSYGKGNVLMWRKHADVNPTIYPFPLLILASCCLVLVSSRLVIVPVVLVPLLYSRWAIESVRTRELEPLLYGYIQCLEEWWCDVGFVKGVWDSRACGW